MLVCAIAEMEKSMNDATFKSFHRVAKKMGWMDEGGLDAAEKKVCCIFD